VLEGSVAIPTNELMTGIRMIRAATSEIRRRRTSAVASF